MYLLQIQNYKEFLTWPLLHVTNALTILFFGPCIFIIEEKNKPTKCTKLILD